MSSPEKTASALKSGPALVLLLGLTFAAYANGLGGQFVFDDFLLARYAWQDVPVSEWGWGLPSPEGHAAQRPLVTASFYLDAALFGREPFGYHVINLLLHALAVILAWRVLLRLGLDGRAALIAGLVFALHPVQTESVTYIAGRRDLLLGVTFLGAWLLALRARGGSPPLNGAGAFALYLLALASKEAAIVVPAVIVLAELPPAGCAWNARSPEPREGSLLGDLACAIRRRRCMIVPMLVVGLPWLFHRALFSRHTAVERGSPLIGGEPGIHVLSAAKAQVLLLWRLLFPLELQADYSRVDPLYARGWGDPVGWAAVALLILVLGLILWLLHRRSRFGLAGALLAVLMLPTAQIVPLTELVAEHYLYLPVLAWGIVLARAEWWLRQVPRAWAAAAATGAATLVLVGFFVRTAVRNLDYRDPIAFWSAVERVAPGNARAQVSLGAHLKEAGRPPGEYVPRFERAIELDPERAAGWLNLGLALADAGRLDEAAHVFERVLKIQPRNPDARAMLAGVLLQQRETDAAQAHIEVLAERTPRHPMLPLLRWALAALKARESGSASIAPSD